MANDAAPMSALDTASALPSEPWTMPRLRELGVRLRPVNVLAHGQLREPVDIKRLALLVRNADYKPRGFGALVLRFNNPKGSVLAYKSGKFVIVGSKTVEDSRAIVDRFTAVLQFVVANVVNATDLKFPLRLEGLRHMHGRYCQYEPELFPGLIYRMIDPQVTLLAFVSGKVVITGAKTQEDAERALCKIFPVFLLYRVPRESDNDSFTSSDESGQGNDEAMRDDDDEEDDDFLNQL